MSGKLLAAVIVAGEVRKARATLKLRVRPQAQRTPNPAGERMPSYGGHTVSILSVRQDRDQCLLGGYGVKATFFEGRAERNSDP